MEKFDHIYRHINFVIMHLTCLKFFTLGSKHEISELDPFLVPYLWLAIMKYVTAMIQFCLYVKS
jgi:hypothetical protein